MNPVEDVFAVKIIKSFYAHTPLWAKSIMLGIAMFFGSFVLFVQNNPSIFPEKYQKYIPGFCIIGLLLLQTVSSKKTDSYGVMAGNIDANISTVKDHLNSLNPPHIIEDRGNDNNG